MAKEFEPLTGDARPDPSGFNQRLIGEISPDGKTIEARWERGMGDAGDEWELDFRISYFRK